MEEFIEDIRFILEEARKKAYRAVNTSIVEAYWLIGKRIITEEQEEQASAAYGIQLIEELSKRLTTEYGQGFSATKLKYFRQFYLTFPKSHALRDHLTWTHFRPLLKIENKDARAY